MYNGKFASNKNDKSQLFVRYLPLVFIVLISAIIVLLGYLLCIGSINAVKSIYEFWVENSDNLAFTNNVFVVTTVICLFVAFAILLRKSYLSECINESTVSKQPNTKRKRPVQSNMADYDVSSNEVVWTNEEPANRYGYKF